MFPQIVTLYQKRIFWIGVPAILIMLGLLWRNTVQAEMDVQTVDLVRETYPSEWGVPHPEGMAYAEAYNVFFLLEKNVSEQAVGQSSVVVVSPYESLVNSTRFNFNIGDAINLAYDESESRLLLLGGSPLQLVQVKVAAGGAIDTTSETRYDASRFGLSNPEGMTVDHRGKYLFILDRANSQVTRINLREPLATAGFAKFDLAALGLTGLRGLAVNIENHHLVTMSPSKKMLYELNDKMKLLNQFDMTSLKLSDPLALVFAYTPDQTDHHKNVDLFIADSNLPAAQAANDQSNEPEASFRSYLPAIFQSADNQAEAQSDLAAPAAQHGVVYGKIVEVNLAGKSRGSVSAAAVDVVTLSLVQTIHTSAFSPPSPDPSGIMYVPTTGLIIESDAEVEEMPIFANKNLFGVTLPNVYAYSGFTKHTNEPAGIAYNSDTGQYFVADDDLKRIYIVSVGGDGIFGTTDDTKTHFLTSDFTPPLNDPEGIDFDEGSDDLFIIDGINKEVYRLDAGANGIFDGVLSPGDDVLVNHFDTSTAAGGVGITGEPEGIDFDPNGGNLLLAGGNQTHIYRVGTTGNLIETYDIAAASAIKIAGVTLAPSSDTPGKTNYWLVDRGIDNNVDPSENDGKIYELADTTAPTPTPTPTYTPGSPTPTPTHTPTPGAASLIYFGSTTTGSVGGVSYADEDVLTHNTNTGAYAMYWDGSDVGVTTELKGFELLADNSLLLTFEDPVTITGLGTVEDIDIVRFIPSSIGNNTAGTFEWYFDGSDVGLPVGIGGIDGLAVLSNGHLLLSGINNGSPPGLSSVQDEDLVEFTPTSLGETTAGTWSYYFDGSDVGLADGDSEDVTGAWVDPVNGEIYLTVRGTFSVPGLTSGGEDVFICTPSSLGNTTACTYRLFWDGTAHGFSQIMDTLGVQLSVIVAAGDTVVIGNEPVSSAEQAEETGTDDEEESEEEQQIYLPLIR